MSSILITGGSGLLAINWATRINEFNSVTLGIHHRKITIPHTQSLCVDLESVKQIRQTLDKLALDTVIHTAAISNIEKCEQMPQLAEHINVELANNVAQAAREHGARFVHISTDHLFDGSSPMRTEVDPIAPLNVYAAPRERLNTRFWRRVQTHWSFEQTSMVGVLHIEVRLVTGYLPRLMRGNQ